MLETHTPLFRTACIGATISHVQVFPTHVTYQQKLWREITVAAEMIASVEIHVYTFGYVHLRTTNRRRIICMMHKKQAEALCAAIRTHLLSVERQNQVSSARHYDQ